MKHIFAICAYKESPYLEDCIISLTNQAIKSKIIVTTSTPNEHIRKLCDKFGLTLYIRDGESSLKDDWNFAIDTACDKEGAEYVTIAHQDDIYERNYSKALRKAQKAYPDMTVFCTRYRTIDADGKHTNGMAENVKRKLRTIMSMRKIANKRWVKRSALKFGNGICCPSITYNVKAIGRPVFECDDHFVIDWKTLLRLADMDGRFICAERELMEYRVHDGSETKKNITDHTRENEEYEVFKSIWPKPVAWLIMRFYRLSYKAYDSDRSDKNENDGAL